MCYICGQPTCINPDYCVSQQPNCDDCPNDSRCIQKIDARCSIYHLNTDIPTKLTNLHFDNGANVEEILEAIDKLIGSKFNIPFLPVDTITVKWQAGGPSGHSPKANVPISSQSGNTVVALEDGLFAPDYNKDYKVKVDAEDIPDFLENQMVGGTDGVLSNSVLNRAGLLEIMPTLDILCLLKRIKNEFPDEFCALVTDLCIRLGWRQDTFECLVEELDLIVDKTATDLPEPTVSFVDNNTVYFISYDNNIGHVWTINPATYTNNTSIVYVNETRSGQPYGPTGGTYVSGSPYRGNATSPVTSPAATQSGFYDKNTRTLFIHGNKTYGMDWYDFTSGTWGKVTIDPSVTTTYNNTASADAFTHQTLYSNDNTNLIIAGWGTNSTNRGTRIIIVDKVLRKLIVQRDTVASPIPGFTSNPFDGAWSPAISRTGDIIISKGQTRYRNVAILDSTLTFKQEIVLPISTSGFNSQTGVYWQSFFYDVVNDKIYQNDYLGKVLYIYSNTGSTYVLAKTMNLTNTQGQTSALMTAGINTTTQELFIDISYANNTAGSPANHIVSYKIDRVTLDILKIYIDVVKGQSLLAIPGNKYLTSTAGSPNPGSPSTNGTFTLYSVNPDALNTGEVKVLTLKEVNLNTNVPTGNVKPNEVGDPDYIADYQDNTACPITYTTDCPEDVTMTVTTSQATIEFGLDVDVTKNPALSAVRARLMFGATQILQVVWNLPNTPNPGAFFITQAVTGISTGNTIICNVDYLDSGGAVVHACAAVATVNVL